MRQAKIIINDTLAGILTENESGYEFEYDDKYFEDKSNLPVSLTLPLHTKKHHSNRMFAFFDGLIPEGWILDIVVKNWKIDPKDRMNLLMTCCKDCIGNVSILPMDI